MTPTSKRARSVSSTSSTSDGIPSRSSSPSSKAFRASTTTPLYACTLPPTCHVDAQTFTTLASLTVHHTAYHSFVCHAPPSSFEFAIPQISHRTGYEMQDECGRVFPSDKLLELHLAECHDELRRAREARGEKTFACFHPSCSAQFSTPKTRRRHLIDKHDYPKQYFFGVTIWGVEEVLKKGGGMIRRDWKPRTRPSSSSGPLPRRSRSGSAESEDGTEMAVVESDTSSPKGVQLDLGAPSSSSPSPRTGSNYDNSDGMDDLAHRLQGTSISLVPRSVRKAATRRVAEAHTAASVASSRPELKSEPPRVIAE